MSTSEGWRLLLTLLVVGLVLAGCATYPEPLATWTFDQNEEIGPATTEFTAWVTERDCASGQPSADRIHGPDIQTSDSAVVVTFRVRPLGGFQQCPSNPASPIIVRLPQPLGDRPLLDGGRQPPTEPPICAGSVACE
jgi:hypothetical protein